ncbi:MAG: hypothetical protein JWP48_5476 [Actinoallomurus sp.]|jgi:hypothetical protein|nr:hypothetical protein [Actinoallomurus sp.]
MKCGSQMAVAIVGGYLLGRSHKIQLAVLLALSAAAGGKLPIEPSELLRHTPLGGPLDKLTGDLRGQLVESGMAVAKKAASSGIDSLSDKLQQRADTLRGPAATKGPKPGQAEEPEPPAGRERARVPERKEASDDYDEYEGDESERGEPESERDDREERRPPPRPTRSEPPRRAPRRGEDRPRTGRAPR